MAFTNTDLVLLSHGNDKKVFYHDSGADLLTTVNTAGYYNNTDDSIRMVAGDLILVQTGDGHTAMLEVASVSSGSVTTKVAGVSSVVPVETVSSTATTLAAIGLTALSSSLTATFNLAAPFIGAVKHIIKTHASTETVTVQASTGVTYDGTNDALTMDGANEAVTLVGVSATRWAVVSNTGSVGIS